MPNAISSASPCHVRIGHIAYDVICWTIGDDGVPVPWIVGDHGPAPLYPQAFQDHGDAMLRAGTAREAVEGR